MKTYKNLLLCLFLNCALFAPVEDHLKLSESDCLETLELLYLGYSKIPFAKFEVSQSNLILKFFEIFQETMVKKKEFGSFFENFMVNSDNFLVKEESPSDEENKNFYDFLHLFSLGKGKDKEFEFLKVFNNCGYGKIFEHGYERLLDIFKEVNINFYDKSIYDAEKIERSCFKSILAKIFAYECGEKTNVNEWKDFLNSFDNNFDICKCKAVLNSISSSSFGLYKFISKENTWINHFFSVFLEFINKRISCLVSEKKYPLDCDEIKNLKEIILLLGKKSNFCDF